MKHVGHMCWWSFVLLAVFGFSHVFAQDGPYLPGELNIQISPEITSLFTVRVESGIALTGVAELDALNRQSGVTAITPLFKFPPKDEELSERYGLNRTFIFNAPAASDIPKLAEAYQALAAVVYAEPNFIARAVQSSSRGAAYDGIELTPNDPLYPDQWAHENTGQAIPYSGGGTVGTPGVDIDTDLAWDLHTGDNSIILSIIDTGVDYNHPEFAGRIVAGYDFINNDNDPMDDGNHGTACAGIAAAAGNNGIGVAGVNWGCQIMPVKVLNASGSGSYASIANGITFAADNGSRVLSLSLGGTSSSSTLLNAVNYAYGLDCVIMAARGNNNNVISFYPASYANAIAVGAISPCDERKNPSSCDGETWWGSSYGSDLDFMAPGTRIHTTDITGSGGYSSGDYTSTFNGTSSATPFAAGVAALLRSYIPVLTNADIRQRMRDTAIDMGTPGFDNETGYGRINAYNALIAPFPDINISSTSFTVNLTPDEVATEILTIYNTAAPGAGNLNWTISKQTATLEPENGLEQAISVNLANSNNQEIPDGKNEQPITELVKGQLDARIGPAVTEGAGGPDIYGYTWTDRNEPGGPTFSWVDISTTGTMLSQGSSWVQTGVYSAYDEGYIQVSLPFPFNFYGTVYTSVHIGSNGYVSFQAPTGDTWSNQTIPNADALNNTMAAFWDDLQVSGSAAIYYGQSGNDFVVQFTNMLLYGSSIPNYTYEYILKPSGEMLFQYQAMGFNGGTLTSCTVGIENAAASTGLQIAYNTSYLDDNLAVLIQEVCPWLSATPSSGSTITGGSDNVDIEIDATGLTSGTYNCNLVIASNDPDENPVTVPITLNVVNMVTVNAKIFLEGPYNSGGMSTYLGDNDLLPAAQPFNMIPWNYSGTESVGSIPEDVVDWVLVELRSSIEAISTVGTRAAFIKSDGSVVDLDGSSPVKFEVAEGDYYIVIHHRNHLSIMSSVAHAINSPSALYDFTIGSEKFYGTGGAVEIEPGIWAMYGGDCNHDGNITISDNNIVMNNRNQEGYEDGDINLDGNVTVADNNLVMNNRNKSAQVPQ